MKRLSPWLVTLLAAGTLQATACAKSDSGASAEKLKSIEARIAKLEASEKKVAELDEFLRPIMAQQQAQKDQKEASEPDPDARFAVNIEGNQFDGPANAAVTIVEAWDFA